MQWERKPDRSYQSEVGFDEVHAISESGHSGAGLLELANTATSKAGAEVTVCDLSGLARPPLANFNYCDLLEIPGLATYAAPALAT